MRVGRAERKDGCGACLGGGSGSMALLYRVGTLSDMVPLLGTVPAAPRQKFRDYKLPRGRPGQKGSSIAVTNDINALSITTITTDQEPNQINLKPCVTSRRNKPNTSASPLSRRLNKS